MPKASAADQLRLLDIQALDTKATQLAHRRATLPSLARLAELTDELSEARGVAATQAARASDIGRELTKAEADVDLVRTRAERNEAKLASGVGTAKDLVALQSELEMLARRRADLEDVLLEVMERQEGADAEQVASAARVAELEQLEAGVKAEHAAELAALDAEGAEVAAQRADLIQGVDAGLLALYDKIRTRGTGAAELRARRCGGCHLDLNATELGRFRDAPDDEVLRCDECGCILVRTDESGL